MTAVKGNQRIEIKVAQIVGVDDHDIVGIVCQIRIGCHGAGRAQERRLVRLNQAETTSRVHTCDVGANGFGMRMSVDPCLGDPDAGQVVDPKVNQWPAADRYHALGNRVGQRTQPNSGAACQQKRADTR